MLDIFKSEKGMFALVVLVAGSVLAYFTKQDFAAWQEFAVWVLGIYTGGKAVHGAAAALKGDTHKVRDLEANLADAAEIIHELSSNDDAADAAAEEKADGEKED